MLTTHHGVFITSPEYNASVTPLLKNSIDWISRVREHGEPLLCRLQGPRVCARLGLARPAGGLRSLMALRQILELGCGALVIPEQINVGRAEQAFDEMDNLKDESLAATLKAAGAPAGRHGARERARDRLMRGQGTPQGTRQDTRQGTPLSARDRLIVALDLPSVEAAQAMVERLGDAVSFYKIGYQLAFAGGLAYRADAGRRRQAGLSRPQAARHRQHGRRRASKSVARLGATFLTVHAYPQTMQAAVDARGAGLRILAVTVLTSYDDADLAAAGYDASVPQLVAERAAQARDIGVDGLVCSAEEAAALRAHRRAGAWCW